MVTHQITECRVARQISKADLARRIGRSRSYMTRVENGHLQPGASTMLRIARYFGKPVEEIFQLVEPNSKTHFPSVSGSGQERLTPPENER